jgi:heptosyltransferase III
MILPATVGRYLRALFRRLIVRIASVARPPLAEGSPLNPDTVCRILVCRPNAKLGNTLLLTPLLVELHRQYPNAVIDLVSAYPRAAQLLRGLPGLRRILPLSHKPAAAPVTYARQIAAIRRESYDLAIDPTPQSISGRITLCLSRSRYRLGFTGRNLRLRLTHACPSPTGNDHESLRPLSLLRPILTDQSNMQTPLLYVALDEAEHAAGRSCIEVALATSYARHRYVIGYFTDAAPGKTLDHWWWRAFWERFQFLEPDILPVELLRWSRNERIDSRHASVSILCPKQMAAAMAQLDLFICGDTGPMHLASATPVPTVGLFTTTDPSRFGPRKQTDLALRVLQVDPADAARGCVRHLRSLCHALRGRAKEISTA